jgi:hypothetical protein
MIVAKATSDTIWDWKIQEDDLFEQRNKKAFSDTKNIRLATVQNGGLIIYIPKTASKCLLNYILYRTKN